MNVSSRKANADIKPIFEAVYQDLCTATMDLLALEQLYPTSGNTSLRPCDNVILYFNGLCFHHLFMTLGKLIDTRREAVSLHLLFKRIRHHVCVGGQKCNGLANDEAAILPNGKNLAHRVQKMRHMLFAHHAFPFNWDKFMLENGVSLSEVSAFLGKLKDVVDKYSEHIFGEGRTTNISFPPESLKDDLIVVLEKAKAEPKVG